MNVDFINPFITSIQDILATMATMTVEYGKPYLKSDDLPLGVVSGLIPMEGDEVHGSLAISFSEGAILKIASAMLGEEISQLDETCSDLTGEFTNMLSGGARKLLWEKGYNFEMAQPKVIMGDEPIQHLARTPAIVIPFNTKAGDFFVEVSLEENLRRAKSIS